LIKIKFIFNNRLYIENINMLKSNKHDRIIRYMNIDNYKVNSKYKKKLFIDV